MGIRINTCFEGNLRGKAGRPGRDGRAGYWWDARERIPASQAFSKAAAEGFRTVVNADSCLSHHVHSNFVQY
jgi:hypothetical protein